MRQFIEAWLLWLYQFITDWPCSINMLFSRGLSLALAALLGAINPAKTESLADIDHVILFMQGRPVHIRLYHAL
jgi:hypothetical protein